MKQQDKNNRKKILLKTSFGLIIVLISALLTMSMLAALYRSQSLAPFDGDPSVRKPKSVSTYISERNIKADSYKTFAKVCAGYTITNTATFRTRSSAVIATFTQSPRVATTWVNQDVGYGKKYAAGVDYLKIDTVACLMEIRDTRVFSKLCNYDEDGRNVAIKYYSVKYKLSYFEASNGFRIADVGNIESPADTCPTFPAYDQQTLSVAATPDVVAIERAHDTFIKSRQAP